MTELQQQATYVSYEQTSREGTYGIVLPIREPAGSDTDDSSSNHICSVMPVIHCSADRDQRSGKKRNEQNPSFPGISSSIVDSHF